MSLQGCTALMCVSSLGHLEVAKLLVRAGADVNASNRVVSLQQLLSSSGKQAPRHDVPCWLFQGSAPL